MAHSVFRLLVRQEPEDGGFSLMYAYFKPNYPLLRHKHEDDCLYVVISGEANMGSQTLKAGDSLFVPRSRLTDTRPVRRGSKYWRFGIIRMALRPWS